MPLTSDPDLRYAIASASKINFPMWYGHKEIRIVVTLEALRDMAASDSRPNDVIENLFEDYRDRVEQIASDKFDAGDLHDDEPIQIVSGETGLA